MEKVTRFETEKGIKYLVEIDGVIFSVKKDQMSSFIQKLKEHPELDQIMKRSAR
ncbi:MAG TPA: hypothetical protein PKK26_18835 [Candidatus Wallbacteria bacterium]|nr:hypothetical protein [Candidatus Wallbacteria bacterium]